MLTRDPVIWYLVGGGGVVMALMLLRGVTMQSLTHAQALIDQRRAAEAATRAANIEAEAAGRAAALEPLNLNPDGTIEEPIIGVVEGRRG